MKQMTAKIKPFLCVLLLLALAISISGCGGKELAEPDDATLRRDVQDYITELLDPEAEIEIFEKQRTIREGDTLEVVCKAYFGEGSDEGKGVFTLSYLQEDGKWVLDRCRVELEQKEEPEESLQEVPEMQPEEPEPEDEPEEEPEPEETPEPEAAQPADPQTSDNWKDFVFELSGATYQLPCAYRQFELNGWKLNEEKSDIKLTEDVPAYTRVYIYLTNGAVEFSADLINMSGNARQAQDCNIGGITVRASNNLGLKIAKNITCTSTKEEVEAAFGTPSSSSNYDDYSSLKYEADTYVKMSFYIYTEKTTYNEITLQNFVATEADATVASEERPDYLDAYTAPTSLSNDMTKTQFILDGKYYQLPCPLEVFLDAGWTISSDSIGSVGAGNTDTGMTLKKDDAKIYVGLINFAKVEVISKNCAVYQVEFSTSMLSKVGNDYVYFPGWLTLSSSLDTVKSTCSKLERYDGSSYTSFSYNNQDYSVKTKYTWYDDGTAYVTLTNKIWNY